MFHGLSDVGCSLHVYGVVECGYVCRAHAYDGAWSPTSGPVVRANACSCAGVCAEFSKYFKYLFTMKYLHSLKDFYNVH